jgi:spermidine/putrescine transport system substrate-binding protein
MEERLRVFRISTPGAPTRLSRRNFLKVVGGLMASFLAARCAPPPTPTPTKVPPTPAATPTEIPTPKIGGIIHIITWEGYENPKAFQPFYDKYGVTPSTTYIGSNDEVLTKYRAGGPGTYDVTCINNRYVQVMAEEGMIIPLDESRIPNFKDLYPAFKEVPYARYKGQLMCVPAYFGFDKLCYNADLVDAPETWDFWKDPKYAGKWGLLDNPAGNMLLWGTILGYGPDGTKYTKDMLSEIVKYGKECRASAKTILKSFGEMKDLLIRGDILVGGLCGWEAVTAWGAAEGANLPCVLPPGPAKCWSDNYMIFNGAPNLDTAYAWVNYAISPEAMAILGPGVSSLISNPKALPLMDPEHVKAMGYETVEEQLKNAQWSVFPPKEAKDPYITIDDLFKAYEEIMTG